MLNKVLEVVGAEGWFDISRPFEKTIYMTHGWAHWIMLSRGGQGDTFVKFSEIGSLMTEARRLSRAAERYPALTPKFVGHVRRGCLDVMAARAVDFRSFAVESARSRRAARLAQERLLSYFRAMCENEDESPDRLAWLQDFEEYFHTHPKRVEALQCSQLLREVSISLASRPQHGDFVVNNLGLRQSGGLVIFDWEDYESVNVPGLDLFSLVYSLDQCRAAGGGHHPLADHLDVTALCEAMGLQADLFRELQLSYAFVFRYLKRDYAPTTCGRLDRLIDCMSTRTAGFR